MPRVFVSHSTQDRDFVEQEIIGPLESCGVETWYSKDSIQPTDQWERSILAGLKACDCFLLVMSPRSAQSPWVKREVDWVFNKGGKRIIPVLLEDCDPDEFHFGIRSIQYVDFSKDRTRGRQAILKLWSGFEQPGTEEQIRLDASAVLLQKAKVAVRLPGWGLVVCGACGFLVNAFILAFGITTERYKSEINWPAVIGATIILSICLLASGVVAFAGISMVRLHRYRFVLVGSVLATFGTGVCSVFGLPCGIWAMFALRRPGVRAAFK